MLIKLFVLRIGTLFVLRIKHFAWIRRVVNICIFIGSRAAATFERLLLPNREQHTVFAPRLFNDHRLSLRRVQQLPKPVLDFGRGVLHEALLHIITSFWLRWVKFNRFHRHPTLPKN
jgi:hypothetical protein